jgi:hypothetical protein
MRIELRLLGNIAQALLVRNPVFIDRLAMVTSPARAMKLTSLTAGIVE